MSQLINKGQLVSPKKIQSFSLLVKKYCSSTCLMQFILEFATLKFSLTCKLTPSPLSLLPSPVLPSGVISSVTEEVSVKLILFLISVL